MKLSDLDKGLALRSAYYDLFKVKAALNDVGVGEVRVGAYTLDLRPDEVLVLLDARVAAVAAELGALGIDIQSPAETLAIEAGTPR